MHLFFLDRELRKQEWEKDFYENSKTAAEVIDRASELLGLDMKALCFEENDLLDQTEYTQAALVTVCMAMEKVLRERGLARMSQQA